MRKEKLFLYRIKETPYTIAALNEFDAVNKWFERDVALAKGGSSFIFSVSSVDQIERVSTAFHAKKAIYNDETFSEYSSEIMDAFCLSMIGDIRFTRKADPENNEDDIEGADFMYTDKGANLVERLRDRLYKVGFHYWEDGDIIIETAAFMEE